MIAETAPTSLRPCVFALRISSLSSAIDPLMNWKNLEWIPASFLRNPIFDPFTQR